MNNWQATGTVLTGLAALITAGVGLYDKLKTVQEELYKPVTAEGPVDVKREFAIVEDPDGWVNLREKPDINSSILARIQNNTHLEIKETVGDWYRVYTESGRKGYIFKNRLIIVNDKNN
jgi:uncharacterized protein YgiM (DUF1202 family)